MPFLIERFSTAAGMREKSMKKLYLLYGLAVVVLIVNEYNSRVWDVRVSILTMYIGTVH